MPKCLKQYPISICLLLAILYLSLFNPPEVQLKKITHFDKWVHALMYLGLSAVLWTEYIRAHRRQLRISVLRGMLTSMLIPLIFGGLMEVLQELLTKYREADFHDLIANIIGICLISIVMIIYIVHRNKH